MSGYVKYYENDLPSFAENFYLLKKITSRNLT